MPPSDQMSAISLACSSNTSTAACISAQSVDLQNSAATLDAAGAWKGAGGLQCLSIRCLFCLQQQHQLQVVHRGEQEVPNGLHEAAQAAGPPPCTSALATGITHGSLESLPETQVKVQVSTGRTVGKGHKEYARGSLPLDSLSCQSGCTTSPAGRPGTCCNRACHLLHVETSVCILISRA